MADWLLQNRNEYRLMMTVLNHFLQQGFNPVPTAPAQGRHYREDHTQAILELLSSFPESHLSFPLKVFSLGPVYDAGHGRWAETIDVEILGEGGAGDELLAAALIMELIGVWPGLAEDTMMVLGHLSILDQALATEGLPPGVRREIRQALSAGNLVQADILMASQAPKAQALLLSQSYGDFVRALRAALPEADFTHLAKLECTLGVHTQTRWDLSLTGNWPYYTDLVFSLYLKDLGQPLLNGGRFSSTVHGRTWHGVGFTLYLDSLYQAVQPETEGGELS